MKGLPDDVIEHIAGFLECKDKVILSSIDRQCWRVSHTRPHMFSYVSACLHTIDKLRAFASWMSRRKLFVREMDLTLSAQTSAFGKPLVECLLSVCGDSLRCFRLLACGGSWKSIDSMHFLKTLRHLHLACDTVSIDAPLQLPRLETACFRSHTALHVRFDGAQCSHLQDVDLSSCDLRVIPSTLSLLPCLKRLSLDYNDRLAWQVGEGSFPMLLTLRELSMRYCGLHTMPNITKCPCLQSLDVSRNILHSGFDVIRRAPCLQRLDISRNIVTSLEPLHNFASLTCLNLACNPLLNFEWEDEGLRLPKLQHLIVSPPNPPGEWVDLCCPSLAHLEVVPYDDDSRPRWWWWNQAFDAQLELAG
jgi:Leucine-rich repeat (LRR) protein